MAQGRVLVEKVGQGVWDLFTGLGHFRSQRTQAAVNGNRMTDEWSIRPGEGTRSPRATFPTEYLCSPHSCRQGPEPTPPSSCCHKSAQKLLATPTSSLWDRTGRALGPWERRSRLFLRNVQPYPTNAPV